VASSNEIDASMKRTLLRAHYPYAFVIATGKNGNTLMSNVLHQINAGEMTNVDALPDAGTTIVSPEVTPSPGKTND
jgi:hypothetical protein